MCSRIFSITRRLNHRWSSTLRHHAVEASAKATLTSGGDDTRTPARAKVVIIGGGVVGCSVAYHLTKLGIHDVVLLESGQLTCGTTWHAAGLIGQLRPTRAETELSGVYGAKLYESLEKETGFSTGFKRCGSITVARTEDRMLLLQRTASRARAFGIDATLISATAAGDKYAGLMRTDDLLGALWLPGDGSANASDLCQALAAGARQGGARIFERRRVTGFHTAGGAVRGVKVRVWE
jgi:glycine/D-amino acid oxidase-like deaminating enzyme